MKTLFLFVLIRITTGSLSLDCFGPPELSVTLHNRQRVAVGATIGRHDRVAFWVDDNTEWAGAGLVRLSKRGDVTPARQDGECTRSSGRSFGTGRGAKVGCVQ